MRLALALLLALLACSALAQEPVGCDKFKWQVDKERAMLAQAAPVASGGEVKVPLASAFKVALAPFAESKLPSPPSRAPRNADSYAGYLRVAALPKAGTYRVTLSQGGWIDVFQDSHAVQSIDASGAVACEGLRKSVKFNLSAAPVTIQVSGVRTNSIGVVLTPD